MIDRNHALPITRQAEVLGISHGAASDQRGRTRADAPHRRVASGEPIHGGGDVAARAGQRGH